jgi:hypothetical protein
MASSSLTTRLLLAPLAIASSRPLKTVATLMPMQNYTFIKSHKLENRFLILKTVPTDFVAD